MHKIDWCEGGLQLVDTNIKNVGEHDLTPRMKYIMVTNECWRNGQTVNGQVMSWRVIITSHLKDENAVVAEK